MKIVLRDLAYSRIVVFEAIIPRTEMELDIDKKEVRIWGIGVGLIVVMNGKHPFIENEVWRGFSSYREVGVLDVLKNFMFRLAQRIDEEERKGTTLLDLTEFE